jgi:hypothetical protein
VELAPLPIPNIDLDAVAAVTYSAVFSDVCDRLGAIKQQSLVLRSCAAVER